MLYPAAGMYCNCWPRITPQSPIDKTGVPEIRFSEAAAYSDLPSKQIVTRFIRSLSGSMSLWSVDAFAPRRKQRPLYPAPFPEGGRRHGRIPSQDRAAVA